MWNTPTTNAFDGRKLNRKTLEADIKALGLTKAKIYEWIARYREGGSRLSGLVRHGETPAKTGTAPYFLATSDQQSLPQRSLRKEGLNSPLKKPSMAFSTIG